MIISFAHKYIFFRTRKTASSTVEAVLKDSLGPDDIVTRRKMVPVPPLKTSLNGSDDGRPGEARRDAPFYAHMTAAEIVGWLPDGFWNQAFKFTIERHPYERIVSLVYHQLGEDGRAQRKHGAEDFATCLDAQVRRRTYASFPIYSIDGRSVIDEFIRQENLHPDLKRIGARLGIPIPDELPWLKSSFRTDRRPAHEVLSQEQKDIVYETCRQEFDLLGYER